MTDDSKAAIARAATAEFAQFGFHGARTARIARAAGVNKQLLFYYFDSKAGLYAEAVRSAATKLRAATLAPDGSVQTEQHGAASLRSWMATVTLVCRDQPQLVRLVLGSSEGPPEAASIARTFLQELAGALAEEVSAGQGLGFFRDDADPTLVATQALTLTFGSVLLDFPSESDAGHEGRRRWDAEAADWMIRRLSW